MSWADVEWTTTETISKTKLDQMLDNVAFLRNELDYKYLGGTCTWQHGAVDSFTGWSPGNASVGQFFLDVLIDEHWVGQGGAHPIDANYHEVTDCRNVYIGTFDSWSIHQYRIRVLVQPYAEHNWEVLGDLASGFFWKGPDDLYITAIGLLRGMRDRNEFDQEEDGVIRLDTLGLGIWAHRTTLAAP